MQTACKLTYPMRSVIDYPRALAQHDAYCAALREAGCLVEVLPADDHLPDCAFIEDAVFVVADLDLVVATRPGARSRFGEVGQAIAAIGGGRRIGRIGAPATLDGGDIMRIGRRFFVGLGARTNFPA